VFEASVSSVLSQHFKCSSGFKQVFQVLLVGVPSASVFQAGASSVPSRCSKGLQVFQVGVLMVSGGSSNCVESSKSVYQVPTYFRCFEQVFQMFQVGVPSVSGGSSVSTRRSKCFRCLKQAFQVFQVGVQSVSGVSTSVPSRCSKCFSVSSRCFKCSKSVKGSQVFQVAVPRVSGLSSRYPKFSSRRSKCFRCFKQVFQAF
jgi:hypothetical protein